MSGREDGGAAFPRPVGSIKSGLGPYGRDGLYNEATPGMTLRDYFAAHAPFPCGPMDSLRDDAEARYRWADFMLAERNK